MASRGRLWLIGSTAIRSWRAAAPDSLAKTSFDLIAALSVKQAVQILADRGVQVDDSNVRRSLASGRLRGEKMGRDWLVDTRSLDTFQLRRTVKRES